MHDLPLEGAITDHGGYHTIEQLPPRAGSIEVNSNRLGGKVINSFPALRENNVITMKTKLLEIQYFEIGLSARQATIFRSAIKHYSSTRHESREVYFHTIIKKET